MKNIITLCSILLLSTTIFAAKEQPEVRSLKGADAAKVFSYASEVWITNDNNIPEFVEFRQDAQVDELNFFPILKKCFQLPASYGAALIRTEKDKLGWENSRYQLTVNGVLVNEGIFVLHVLNGKVVKYNGYVPKTVNAPATPSLSESSALHAALTNINATTYRWQDAKNNDGGVNSTFFPKGQLCIVQGYNEIGTTAFHLAWKFDVFATVPLSRDYVYVDAQTGAIIRKDNRIETANTNATAATVYRGNRAIVTDSYNGSYRLRETTRGNGINTYNMHTGTSYAAATDFTNATTTWSGTNTAKDQYARDAHWGAEMTMDFYLNKQGRNGIDGNGFALKLYVHYDNAYLNAFWDGTEMNFGDGSTGYQPLTSLDITGHEISHGLTQFTANLNYQNESGAMNEAFSDIMGTAVEYYGDSTRANWLVGEDIGAPFRSMSSPKTYQQPNTYLGQYWYAGTQDNGGVHTNSGIENYWYYLLSMGGTGTNDNSNAYNVTGIGRQKATQIAFRMETVYLISTSQYTNARAYAIQAAIDIFGACSQEVISTANAWYAVGVGSQYSAAASSQFSYSNTVACAAPYTVNFTNLSSNMSTYTWYFGDGQTSTAVSPSHTYIANGVYTVKLVASGNCGTDSVTKPNLVNISSSNPCIVVLPTSGSADVQTSCTGTIYDNGGAHAQYSNNVNSTVTISPLGASTVRLTFTQFRAEANYDYLYVYDGTTVAGTLLGTYTGYTLPASVTSTLPSITVKFVSDPGVVDTGFAINWTCTAASTTPVANFKSDVTTTCSGVVQFTDMTTGGATSWLWNFGDGVTSTLRNPLHTYYTNGTYTVTLQATNSFGNNLKTITNMITVNKPAAPAVVNGSRCGSGSVTLSATTNNNVNWYDSANGSVALSSANPFNTPSISSTKNYYVEEAVPQPIYHVGPVDSTIGAGAYFNGNSSRALRFKVNKPSKLLSVFVYALTTGYRTIQYRDTNGVVIASRSVYIQAGRGRVNLNITLIPSTTTIYELGVADSMNLFRNSAGGTYPYNDSQGMVSIIGNNISNPVQPGYYYYFYDWMVEAPDCVSLRATATATIGGGLTGTKTSAAASCNGAATGSASVTPTSGTGPYTYHWNTGQNTASISNVVAGTYYVTLTDNGGCSKLDTVVIGQPTTLSASATKTDVLCFGGSTGAISASAAGGTTNYNYNWGGGVTTPGRTNLGAGTYTVTVTDAHGCTAASTSTITQPTSALAASATATNVLCFGGTTGTITASASGGTSGYGYNWGGGITTPGRTNLAAGSYTVTVTDAHGCTATYTSTITQPTSALAATATKTDVLCFGGSTGAITVSGSGGTANYNYNWGGGITTPGRTNLPAGTYTVTVTDGRGCITTNTNTITQPSAALVATTSTTGALCFGGATGAITASASGGTTSYGYNWGGGITTPGRTNLSAGTYTVTVTDAHGCIATSSATISQPTSALAAAATKTDVLCFGGATGAITASASGGTSGYGYNWGGGITTPGRTNLPAGTYTVTITDGNGCTTTNTSTITQPSSALSATATTTDVQCFGGSTGAITVAGAGGTANYSYNWGGGVTTPGRTNLAAGTYTTTVTDAHGCTAVKTTTITQPTSALVASSTTTGVSCFGGNNGTITATANGGTANYSYNWGGGITTPGRTNLAIGTYTVTVTDAHNCTTTKSTTVTQPAAISIQTSSTPASCGQNTGTATASASGGTGALSYAWPGSRTTPTISGLSAGNYTITVTDANNCTSAQGVNVISPAPFSLSNAINPVTCSGGNNGTASIIPSINPGTYSYSWTGGLIGASQSNLAAGLYLVNVTDGNNCSRIDSIVISEPQAITDALTATDPLCHGGAGSIGLQAQGGTGTLNYQWSPSLLSLTGVTAGTYHLTITDANNCVHTDIVTLTDPSAISIQSQITDVLCNGGTNGSASVTSSGGAGNYSYNWSTVPINQTNTISNANAGSYTVTVTDANNCSSVLTLPITSPSAIQTTTSSTLAHNGGSDGTATVSASGGTGTLTYSWNTTPVQTAATATNLPTGSYTVTVTDANGCNTTAQVNVDYNVGIIETTGISNLSIYPNPASTVLNISIDMQTASDLSIEVRDMLGRTITNRTFANEKDVHTSIDVSAWAAAVYTVQIKTGTNIITKEITIQH
ncbi:MAG: C-terminal target protein [Bacteroidetes bacterium]|nr:C-terminal target protein [Bacteroidota bacterium]